MEEGQCGARRPTDLDPQISERWKIASTARSEEFRRAPGYRL
jgi:hypothetical protein